MQKTIVATLVSIYYSGDSIGDDIRIEGEIMDKKFSLEKQIQKGETAILNSEIGKMTTDKQSLTIPLAIRVIEKDFLFSDVGSITQKITVNTKITKPQENIFHIEVGERKRLIGKRKAVFEIVCKTQVKKILENDFSHKSIKWWEQWKEIQKYSYKGVAGKEDYNRYDSVIQKNVAQWNKEFCDDIFPPDEPLDPNLVKAIMYQESRIGYFQSSNYSAYPDVMQVADPRNPAIHTLNNDGWKNKKGARAQEREWSKGKISILDYRGKANGTSPEESIRWGIRWLYHCAQGISVENTRYWRSWKEAVERYNKIGNKKYAQEVFRIYENGIDTRSKPNIKLFLIFIAILLLCATSFGAFALHIQESRFSRTTQESSLVIEKESDSEMVEKKVKAMMVEKMSEYKKQDNYYYGELFREPFLLCQRFEDTCFSDLIFPTYLNQFLAYAKNMNVLREVLESLEITTPYTSFYDDLDNDGVAELGLILIDNLNHDYIDVFIFDRIGDLFHTAQSRLALPYSGGPPRIFDITGDGIPEIFVFTSGGRQDIELYVFQYVQGELKKFFELDRGYLRADIIFTDQNHNHLPEIHVKGEQYGDECMSCDHKKVEDYFEYDPQLKKIKEIRSQVFWK